MAGKIITIGREYGSGGRQIGEGLAKELGIPYYDKEILRKASQDSGICDNVMESYDEKPTSSFLYSLVMDPYATGFIGNNFHMPLNHKVFIASFDAIKSIAEEGPCVIVGRCADYALADNEDVISIFIHAPIEERIKRTQKRLEVDRSRAEMMINKADKQRASYYNYYTTKKWGDTSSYHLTIDSSLLGIDGTIQLLKDIYINADKARKISESE